MSVELSQESRLLRIDTSTGKDFVLRRVEAVEAISRPYVVQAEVVCTDGEITAADVTGRTLCDRSSRAPSFRRDRADETLHPPARRTGRRCFKTRRLAAMLRPGQRSRLMSVALSQESRLLRIDTSTGQEFVLRRVEAVEEISRLYVVQVEVLCTDGEITAGDVIGQTALVTITRDEEAAPRLFHGVINAFRKIGRFGTNYTAYGLRSGPHCGP